MADPTKKKAAPEVSVESASSPAPAVPVNGEPAPNGESASNGGASEIRPLSFDSFLAKLADGSDGGGLQDRMEVLDQLEARLDEICGRGRKWLDLQRTELCKQARNQDVQVAGCANTKADRLDFLEDPMVPVAISTGALVAASPKSASGTVGLLLPAVPVVGALIANRDKGTGEALKSAIAPAVIGGIALLLRQQFG